MVGFLKKLQDDAKKLTKDVKDAFNEADNGELAKAGEHLKKAAGQGLNKAREIAEKGLEKASSETFYDDVSKQAEGLKDKLISKIEEVTSEAEEAQAPEVKIEAKEVTIGDFNKMSERNDSKKKQAVQKKQARKNKKSQGRKKGQKRNR